MSSITASVVDERYDRLEPDFPKWEKIKDVIDQFIDISLNYRQSGHPGGSRSKVHLLVATLLSGVMRWDIRHPEKRFGDRFILSAGHCVPLIYATFACLNESLRAMHDWTGDDRYVVPNASELQLTWADLSRLRRNHGLAGHAESEGKTLFLKANTGPSGHGSPPSAGEAMALKRAGAEGVKVFTVEGEGGLTPGAAHETKNSAWGLGLDNLYYLVDWNDYGIDDFAASTVVNGTPESWFAPYGWRVFGTEDGSEFGPVTRALLETHLTDNNAHVPSMTWFKTRKGRDYLVYDYKSHGAPHKMNSELFWELRKQFADKYGTRWVGMGEPVPTTEEAIQEQCLANLKAVAETMREDRDLCEYLANRLTEIGDSVPAEISEFKLETSKNPWQDERLFDFEKYPKEMFVAPGSSAPNRAALAKWGAWVNSFGRRYYGRPLVIACSADLAESTNIAGFAHGFGETKGWGRWDRNTNHDGALLPQEITEFTNAGISAGIATVNLSPKPFEEFDGFYGACSTYGSFSYLKYGPLRLFSQLAQDSQIKVGKVIWVAGHSGPETADDSRTHFGVFAPAVTQLFPEGRTINLYPWEHNEVPVLLAAALRQDAPIVAIHLTRPPIQIPDRAALGMPSHFAAARGAYVLRPYRPDQKPMGTVFVLGTMSTFNLVKLFPELDQRGLNVKVVAAVSPELFRLQSEEYRNEVASEADWLDSMCITNGARRTMHDWLSNKVAEEYTLSSDFDNRWRTGGNLGEVIEEAHLSPHWILAGLERFVKERDQRLGRISRALQQAQSR
ncbi:MAG: transketolase [Chloroflexota bacterium]